ncbi:Glutamine synthetase, type III [Parasponia andersonii]|uniref:Glutamine synthetase, type III n=1 Tax=Parasponia andersonii TaxID=3476 RepID=A0A2P5BJN1_PARAD|nr:Glutamine synthetase, type III [Parasponia andersonii]
MDFSELREAVEAAELVDGHAHNIVALDSAFPFIGGFSEAHGDALTYAVHSISVKRNLKDIAELYGCENSLHGIEEFRRANGLESISSTCFKAAKISAILIDDGIKLPKEHDIEWHKAFAPFVGRILRIERLAEIILDEELPGGSSWTLDSYLIITVAGEIFGLKSIAAYRGGLEIKPNVLKSDAEEGLTETLRANKPVRIANKNFIDYIFTQSLEVAQQLDLPMQIHTGFGDTDLDMRLSNPLHLRDVLEDKRFSKCRIVLLHASYPFSKEASHLASVYSQVYLDFGLAVPKLSVHGMLSSVKELLELAPINKVMFSSDGYAFPETFYLGAKKARDVIFSALRDACLDGDLSIREAVEAAKDIFSGNAIKFYKIKLPVKSFGSENSISRIPVTIKTDALNGITLVRILWVDASGQQRCRVVPAARFQDVVWRNGVGLTCASMGMPSCTDGPAEESKLTGVGEIRLIPDLSTRRRIPWETREEMVLADMYVKPGEPWEYCPREALRRVSKILKEEFNLVMNAGFENEFYLLKSVLREGKEEWVPFDLTPYSSTSAYDAASPIFQEVVAALHSMKIPVEQVHAESGKGQFEVVLGHASCTLAADNLVFVRETIKAIARKHGLLATFVPKYSFEDIGSGSHVHVSLFQDGKNVFMGSSRHGMSKVGEEFMAGVLYHLPRILAFIAPIPNSYDRIQPNTWSGAYQCWGKENKEAPLRAACPPGISEGYVSNFEIKSFDGCANPHLGLAAILAAGIDGLRRHLSLPEPVDTNPSSLGAELQRLPKSLSESLAALNEDNVMTDLIGEKLLVAIKGVRKAEIDFYSKHKDAYKQLIYRY